MSPPAARDARWPLTLRVGAVVAAWVWWAFLPSAGWVALLAVAPVGVSLIRQRSVGPPLLAVSLAVFLSSAGVALWATYDPDAARPVFDHPVGWQKLWGLVLSVCFFYALVTIRTGPAQRWAIGLVAGLGALVAAGFVATNDWAALPALWPPVTGLGEALQGVIRSVVPWLPRGVLNPNVAGGVTAPLLPLAVGLAVEGRRTGKRTWLALGGLAGAAILLALVLTTSRGAWLGLAGALVLTGIWWVAGRAARGTRATRRLPVFLGIVVVVAAVGAVSLAVAPALRRFALAAGPVPNRLAIFSQAALLVRDYALTGSGLGTFPLVHSTYALMIHVPILSHAHALPLDVAVEQGLIGADALLLVWAAAAWIGLRALSRAHEARPLLAASLASLAVLVLHGVVDDALYSSRGVLFLWAPAALTIATARQAHRSTTIDAPAPVETPDPATQPSFPFRSPLSPLPPPLSLLLPLLALAAFAFLLRRPIAALAHANLGAVRQTRVELAAYDYESFDDPTLVDLRRELDLSAATASYQRSLALDPAQVTARTRLSQIALARRDYAAALDHALAAWDAGCRDRVTRLVLGDALAAHGAVEEAAGILAGVERAAGRLEGQAFYEYQRHGDWQRAAYAWRTVLLLDPGNQRVAAAAARAEAEASGP